MSKLSRSWWHGFLVIATVAGAGILTSISLRDFRTEALPPENRPIQSEISGYATSSACRACHAENYTSWHGSFHRTMTQVATPASRPADGFAHIANPVVGNWPRPDFATTSLRLHRRGKNVGSGGADVSDSPRPKGILFSRCLEWRLYGLPRHAGAIAFCRG